MPDDDTLSPDQLKALLEKINPAVLGQVMPLTGGVITMMFTDIVGSVDINVQIGDRSYFDEVLKRHNEVVRKCISDYNGREWKTNGDAFLVGFATPIDAVACAAAIQERLEASPIQAGMRPLQVRIGLHTGTPIVYQDSVSNLIDLSGVDVNKAARVEGLAKGRQVLISHETNALAKHKETYDWGLWELKGLGRHRIFELLWPGKTPERPSGRPWLEPVRFLTRFVGRESEIVDIKNGVTSHRLVTLKGMGGIGKSRLANEVAASLSKEFDDGVFFVELAETIDSEPSVVSELIVGLGINPAGFLDEATALLTTFQNRRALLVLDNFEAVASAASFINRLLKGCPGLHFLVTSQRPLSVDGEQQIEVQPLVVPLAQYSLTIDQLTQLDSFKLFHERARLKKPRWEASPAEASLIGEILELTDGIPLSIELAAAWADRVSLQTLRDGLKQNRSHYLKRCGPAIEEKRHASIQACIDWSFNLLPPAERMLFPKLSAFAGGFLSEDVAAVCEVLNASALIRSIQEQSFLFWEESIGKTRYRMLPTVREYAAAKLGGQLDQLRRVHSQHFLEVLELAVNHIKGKAQMAGFVRVTADLDNIRAGMETATQMSDHKMEVNYSLAFAPYLQMKGLFAELLIRNQQGLSAAAALQDVRLIAGCEHNLGNAYAQLPTGDRGPNLRRAIGYYEAALQVFTERRFPAQWAMIQHDLANVYGDLPSGDRVENLKKTINYYKAALRVFTKRGFPVQRAMTQHNLGGTYATLPSGDRGANLRNAIRYYKAALQVRTEDGFPVQWAMTQNNLGAAYRDLPTGKREVNLQKAINCFDAALRVRTKRDFPIYWAMTQHNLGTAYAELPTGDRGANLRRAISYYEAALNVRTERDFPYDWATTQHNLGKAYAAIPNGDRAENFRKAVVCFEMAIRGYSAVGLPEEADRVKRDLDLLKKD